MRSEQALKPIFKPVSTGINTIFTSFLDSSLAVLRDVLTKPSGRQCGFTVSLQCKAEHFHALDGFQPRRHLDVRDSDPDKSDQYKKEQGSSVQLFPA